MMGFVRKVIALLMASLLATWWYARTAEAHGGPVSLTFWGNYGSAVAACQRTIGQAAAVCGLRALKVRQDCRLADLFEAGCDTAAVDAAIQAARAIARARVRTECSDPEVQTLGYIDRTEAITDVINICRDLDSAGSSASVGALPQVDAGDAACVRATTKATGHLLGVAIENWRTALDRIATLNLSREGKESRVATGRSRMQKAVDAAVRSVGRDCVDPTFEQLYRRSAASHFANVAALADCFAGAVYVQDAVVCPAPTCGNGIEEKGEDCDDGNVDRGDGCSETCGDERLASVLHSGISSTEPHRQLGDVFFEATANQVDGGAALLQLGSVERRAR